MVIVLCVDGDCLNLEPERENGVRGARSCVEEMPERDMGR